MTLDKILAYVRWKREASGMSLRQLARKLGCSPTYLSLVETCKHQKVTQQLIHDIGRVLELDQSMIDEWCFHCHVLPVDIQSIIDKWPCESFALLREMKASGPEGGDGE